jgi:hypothetical protein
VKRVLLDEGVPWDLEKPLADLGVDATAFPNAWKQLSNGAFLNEVERHGYQVLITTDKQMRFEQSLVARNLSVLILPTNRRNDVLALAPQIADARTHIEPKQFVVLTPAVPFSRRR